MKKTTRKSFSRKAIVVVMCVFLTISLTAVGFASWLISNSDSKEGTGNVNASNVSDAILGVEIKNATDLGKINFGPLESDTKGNIQFTTEDGEDKESLTVTVSGSINNFKTLATMSITVKCPDSVLTAAGYTWNAEGERTYTYNEDKAYIALPTCAVDTNGNYLPLPAGGESKTAPMEFENGNAVFKDTADANKKEFTTTIEFKWGALFEGNNPGRYLDGEDGLTLKDENKTALLAIINVGKAEGSKYTTLKAEGDAEAKRDILRAMKVAITGADSYEAAESATAPQFTVVVNAQAK